MTANRQFRIGAAAKMVGRHADTIRSYERKGIIPEARRDIAGQRTYTEEEVAEIRAILLGELPDKVS